MTGTHLSHANTRAAVLKALEYARRHGLRTALDIDYRPVLWGSPRSAMAKPVSLSPDRSPASCRKCCICSIWWWNRRRVSYCRGSTDTLTALKNVRNATKATLVCKRGPMGCVVLKATSRTAGTGAATAGRARGGSQRAGRRGCLYVGSAARLAQRRRLEQACRYANACGALVVSATAARRRCRPKSN